eukprot:8457654-Karenia_brevis.AAC.1
MNVIPESIAHLHQSLIAYAATPQNQILGEQLLGGLLGVLQGWMPGKFVGIPQPNISAATSPPAPLQTQAPSLATGQVQAQAWENA